MPHVELSLTEPHAAGGPPSEPSVDRWSLTAMDAAEPCMVIDAQAMIVAVSDAGCELLGLGEPPVGKSLRDGVLSLIDFSPVGADLSENELSKIPPLLALSSGRLARGLLRVRRESGACTLDAIAAPLLDGMSVAGSLTFLSEV